MNLFRCLAVLGFAALSAAFSAAAQPIKLGELNSYKQFPGFLAPYTVSCWAGREKSSPATTTAMPETPCASPRS